jgi:hypothetical protein
VRGVLHSHAGLTSALTLGVMLSGGVAAKVVPRDMPLSGTGASAPYTVAMAEALVVIDPAVREYQQLLQGVRPGIRTVVLDAERDGLAQISALLAANPRVSTIHLVAHGAPGRMRLGNAWVRRGVWNRVATGCRSGSHRARYRRNSFYTAATWRQAHGARCSSNAWRH